MHTYYANGEIEYYYKETVLLSSTSRVRPKGEYIIKNTKMSTSNE